MTTTPIPQILIKRHPTLTRQEFSKEWERHGLLVAPWFIKFGVMYYAQIHNPELSHPPPKGEDAAFNIGEWDGAAEVVFTASDEQKDAWTKSDPAYKGYLENVIVQDERRFLVSEALGHCKRVEAGTVTGRKVVMIEDGRLLVDIPGEITEEWDKWNTV